MIPPISAQLLYIGFDCQINLHEIQVTKIARFKALHLTFVSDRQYSRSDKRRRREDPTLRSNSLSDTGDARFLELVARFVIDRTALNDVFHCLDGRFSRSERHTAKNAFRGSSYSRNSCTCNSSNDCHLILRCLAIRWSLVRHRNVPNDDRHHLDRLTIVVSSC